MSLAARLAAIHGASLVTPRPWSAREIESLIQDTSVFLCDAESGFALGRAAAGEAELLTLAVTPTARRQGLGRRLLAAFEAEARARGAVTAFLEVNAENTAARALYQAAGYVSAGRRRGYYQTPEGRRVDALVLTRPLAEPAPIPPAGTD